MFVFSTDYGKKWGGEWGLTCPGIKAASATFSEVPAGGYHLVFVAPADENAEHIFIFDAASCKDANKSKYTTPFHFDGVVPHLTNANKFIGVDYSSTIVCCASLEGGGEQRERERERERER